MIDEIKEKEIIDNCLVVLKTTYRFLENLKYELDAREYTLDEDQMAIIFYCRDMIWKFLKENE
jgi:hypothetical protein